MHETKHIQKENVRNSFKIAFKDKLTVYQKKQQKVGLSVGSSVSTYSVYQTNKKVTYQ